MKYKMIIFLLSIFIGFSLTIPGCSDDDDNPAGTENTAPGQPTTPDPENGAVDQELDVTLSWNATDPDSDPLTFDVYFGIDENPALLEAGIDQMSYVPVDLDFGTTYYWKITVRDDHDHMTEGPVWNFTTVEDVAGSPDAPSVPYPEDEAVDQWLVVDLTWECSDPEEDPLTYDLYFGTEEDPVLAAEDLEVRIYNPGLLEYSQTYYWKVIASDDQGHSASSPVWSFSTETDDGENNSFNTADWFEFGEEIEEYIEVEGDEDYFKMNVERPGVIDALVNPVPSDISMYLTLYNDIQEQLQWKGEAEGTAVSISYLAEPGIYYLKVNPRYTIANTDEAYKLLITLDESDVFEINNSFNLSSEIPVWESFQAKIRPARDVDYFKLELPRDGVLDLTVNPVPDDLKIWIDIYDANQERVAYYGRLDYGQAVLLSKLMTGGLCYFALSDDGGYLGASRDFYTCNVVLDTSDVYEANNTFNTAKEIELNTDIQGKIRPSGDLDIFKFTLPDPGGLRIDISNIEEGFATLFGASQERITWEYGVGSTVEIVSDDAGAGLYYVQVEKQHGNSSPEPYTMRITQ